MPITATQPVNAEPSTPEATPTEARLPRKRRSKRARRLLIALCAVLALCFIVGGFVCYSLWHSRYTPTENRFFTSPFVSGRNVLVLVPHEDDEVNLAYGVIDAFAQAGSHVTIAFETNGDARLAPEIRNREAVWADALMGVASENLVFLGYPDLVTNPAFISGDPLQIRSGAAGRVKTYGVNGFLDYHTQRFGQPADYTRANLQADLRQLILDRRPDIIFTTDTDKHVDHMSLSQVFDLAMGDVLRAQTSYKPIVYKGYAYDYAWHGNDDFSQIPLKSAARPWVSASNNVCYQWEDRVRFPMPAEYLSYTLRGSKLHEILKTYASQNALVKQCNLQNSDKIFWERRTDALYGTVTATSGDASQLCDFRLTGPLDNMLSACWLAEKTDPQPTLHYVWDTPQNIDEIVFYDAPAPAGDVKAVQIMVDDGQPQAYSLPDGTGQPCRLHLDRQNVRKLEIRLTATAGEPVGFSEIEVLPPSNKPLQWIKLMNQDQDFCYELPCPAMKALTLPLYGYPSTPKSATVTLTRNGETLSAPTYDGEGVQLPPLPAGRYRLRIESGDCADEIMLRVGDSMLWENGLQWIERKLDGFLPS